MDQGIAEPAAKRPRPDRLVVSANEALNFCLLDPTDEESLKVEHRFHPDMSHQAFGPDEEISGYLDLRVDVTMSQKTFVTNINVDCSRRFPGATDILGKLAPHFPQGYSKDAADFKRDLASQTACIDELGDPLINVKGQGGLQIAVHAVDLEQAPPRVKVRSLGDCGNTFQIIYFRSCIPEGHPPWIYAHLSICHVAYWNVLSVCGSITFFSILSPAGWLAHVEYWNVLSICGNIVLPSILSPSETAAPRG